MVKLEPDEKFVNVMFESSQITESIPLKQLVQADKLTSGNLVVLDSPDTGCIQGTSQAQAYERVLTDDPNVPEQHQWVSTTWYYMGQDFGTNLRAGMCAGAIWTEEGDVGFFRYAPEGGMMRDWCVATAADELINRGFTLVDTSG